MLGKTLNDSYTKLGISQRYFKHGEVDVSGAIKTLLNPQTTDREVFDKAARIIIGEGGRRRNNALISKRKKELLAETRIGDIVPLAYSEYDCCRSRLCALYELVDEGIFRFVRVRSNEKYAVKGWGSKRNYHYRTACERIK